MIGVKSNIIHYLTSKPKTLFLIDSSGALLTAFFLFVVSGNFNNIFGLPVHALSLLAVIAVSYCIYSAFCFFLLRKYWAGFIKIIGIANLLYIALTTCLLIVYSRLLTTIGLAYFLIEISIICGLAYTELKVAAALRKQ